MKRGFNKFNAQRSGTYGSKAEKRRFDALRALQDGGCIHSLRAHPVFEVQPEGCARIRYTPDAEYFDVTGDASGRVGLVAEDTKPAARYDRRRKRWVDLIAPDAKLRMKLFQWKYTDYRLMIVEADAKGFVVKPFGERRRRG